MSFHKIIYLIGARIRNPNLKKHYAFLKNSESLSLEELKKYQETSLFRFLEFVGANSKYYKLVLEKTGWKPGDPFTWDQFNKIPVTEKATLITQNNSIHSNNINEKTHLCETSGTSGQVLTFRRNESWDSFNRASIMRGYSWYDVNPWDFNIYFWGFNKTLLQRIKLRLSDFLINRYRMFSYSEKSVKKLIKKIPSAVYIEGYSSMIYELACAAENKMPDVSSLKMVKGTSEKIYPHYIEKTKAVFKKSIISEYGAAETGIIAFECPQGNMHINMEGVYVETDENNEILVTNFHSYSFPVIRYRLGDQVNLKDESYICSCGLKHPIIEEVTGRIGKLIHGIKNKYPSLTFYYIFKNLYFDHNINLNYQAHQNEIGYIDLYIKEDIDSKTESKILNECSKYFNDDIIITLKQKSRFYMNNGKLRDFISTIE